MTTNKVPSFDQLMNPLLDALRELGGSASIEEMYTKTAEIKKIPEDVLEQLHNPDKGSITKVGYKLAWARTYLRKYGFLENSSRGVWSLSEKAKAVKQIDPVEVLKYVRSLNKKESSKKHFATNDKIAKEIDEEGRWKEDLSYILTEKVSAAAFERLIQRLLRESGFVQVEVTGRSGDGGIDGKGIAKIHGFMSFHVFFQCKKYRGSVGSGDIRDFRGAMVGRADKGLFVTTGTFTPSATKEATRDGAPPIDLVDGNELAEKLKMLSLGIKTEKVEKVIVEAQWFENL